MNKEFFDALLLLEKENGISVDLLIEKIKQGITKAIKKDYPDCENIIIDINPKTGKFDMKILKEIVEGEPENGNQINIDEALTINPNSRVGEMCEIVLNNAQFGRVAAQTAKQSIRHDIKDFERDHLIAQYKDKVKECVTAVVQKVEPATGNATITIDNNEVYLLRSEQIPGEVLREGDIIKVYVVDILNPEKQRPTIKISRTHEDFVRRLFELEVPEIYDGTVQVVKVSREAGVRTKMSVYSKDPNVDAIGACIGPKRSRITAIVNELKGEKIDIIPFSENDEEYIASALAPASIISVECTGDANSKTCKVVAPNNQLSLAIGNKGLNAKLAARLTGYKIDIVPETPINK